MTIPPDVTRKHLVVVSPEGDGKFPVVIFYQGTGGGNRRAERWAAWFKTIGVASAIVDNAGIRNRTSNPWGDYAEDGATAWDLLRAHPQIDTNRFALMGFSRGGQQALDAGGYFGGARPAPSFVFALYPGGWGTNACWSLHRKPTQVHFFYGELDEITGYDGTSHACRALETSSGSVKFHELKGATHGYDDIYS
jgi:dienelactone hydrolase